MRVAPPACSARFRLRDDRVSIILCGCPDRRSENLVRACFASAWNSGCTRILLDLSGLETCDDFVDRTISGLLDESRRRGCVTDVVGALVVSS